MFKKIYNLFPDTIFRYKLENYEKINKELLSYILDLQKKDSIGNNRSNRGGWHSPNFDLVNAGPPINFINNFKDFMFKDCGLWFMFNLHSSNYT